ncbi:MAG: OmpA family protein [Chitinophagales bacterium]|nr:OmpA family protein [Chitinophagales bacterium]
MKRLITIVLVVTQCHLFAFRDVKSTFYFDSDIDTLNQIQYSEIQAFIQHLPEYKQYKEIYIVGYTDADGASDYNIGLSKRRADFVSALLVKNGLPEVLIDKNFKGEDNPVAKNTTELNKSKNRRVEVTLRLFDINTATDIVKEINGNPEQVFYLDNTKENSVQGKNGIKFIFPPYCFKTNGNKKIDYSNIKIVLTEVTNVTQGIFSNVLTESKDGFLETGGMYKLTAYNTDVELMMKENIEYTVQINNSSVKNDMKVYTPVSSKTDGLVRWENTNQPFQKVSTFKGEVPYLRLDAELIKNWHLQNEMDSFLRNYVLQLPVRPAYPQKPYKPSKPYEPRLTDSKYKLPLFQRMFLSKEKRQMLMHVQFDKDAEAYKKQQEKYELKLTQYKSDTATLKSRMAQCEKSFLVYRDSVVSKVRELDSFRLALYENAFMRSFEVAKNSILFRLQNKSLYTYDVFSDILFQCNRMARLKDLDRYYLDIYSSGYKKLKAVCAKDFPYLLFDKYASSDYDNIVYPSMYNQHFNMMMRRDLVVWNHVEKAVDTLIAEQTKLGMFNPSNFKVFYQASLSNFGWINCDRFYNYKPDEIFTLQIPNYNLKDKNVFAVMKDINSQISIPLSMNGKHTIRLPKNKQIIVVAIGLDNQSTPLYAKQEINAKGDMDVELKFKAAKLSEIKEMIRSI